MTLFSDIRYAVDTLRMQKRRVYEILTHKKWVARGYAYLVEYNGRHYMLVNTHDLEVAIAKLPSKTIDNMDTSRIFDVPVNDSEQKLTEVMKGVFQWASRL